MRISQICLRWFSGDIVFSVMLMGGIEVLLFKHIIL